MLTSLDDIVVVIVAVVVVIVVVTVETHFAILLFLSLGAVRGVIGEGG